jgi:hypothetical protein
MKIFTQDSESRVSFTVRVMTPDGVMFVTVVEDEKLGREPKPVQVLITLGKTGSAIAAWANMTALLTTVLLERGVELTDVAMEISNILSDKRAPHGNGIDIRSGPEGLKYAFMRYNENLGNRL